MKIGTTDVDAFQEDGKSDKYETKECRDELDRERLLSVAPAVNNQIQMKQKTGKE